MNTLLVAIPSDQPGGLDAPVSTHFGRCDVYTVVEVQDNTVKSVTALENPPHEEGGCMASVSTLSGKGVNALLAGGMGMRPLAGFRQAGINVFLAADCLNVGQAVQAFLDGKLTEFLPQSACKGH